METREKSISKRLKDVFGEDFKERRQEYYTAKELKSVEIARLIPYDVPLFALYEGERLNNMVLSIKDLGVVVPIIVRPCDDGKYQILSGHNRANAAKIAGLKYVSAVVKERLTEDEALLIVTETNLMQRSFSNLKHSERAVAIAEHHKKVKSFTKQGERKDLINEIEMLLNAHEIKGYKTPYQMGTKLTSIEKSGIDFNLSKNSVARYLRINKLVKILKEKIDLDEIAICAGVELSYISEELQNTIAGLLDKNNFKIDIKKSQMIRSYFESGKLTEDTAYQILSGEAQKIKKLPQSTSFKLRPKLIAKFFKPEQKSAEIEEVIEKAVTLYFENMNNNH